MKTLSRSALQDGLGGFIALTLGIAVMLGISGLTWFSNSGVVGPAVVPGTCGILLIVIGCVQLVGAYSARYRTPTEAMTTELGTAGSSGMVDTETSTDEAEPSNPRIAWVAWAGVLVTAFAMPYLGMLPALGLLTVFLLKVVSKKSWRVTLLYAVCLVAVIYVLFVTLLGIPLPTSPWFG